MTEAQQPQSKKHFRWNLIDLFDFLLWAGVVLAGFTLKIFDPVIIGWTLLFIGIIGATTKGITIFITHPKLILIEAFDYFVLAFSCGILVVFCWVNNCDITVAFGTASIAAVIAGTWVLRKYFGMGSILVSLPYTKKFGKEEIAINNRPPYIKTGVVGLVAGFLGAITGLILINSLRWYLYSIIDFAHNSYADILINGIPLTLEAGGTIALIGGPLFGIMGTFVGLKRQSSRLWLWGVISGSLINLFFSVWPQ